MNSIFGFEALQKFYMSISRSLKLCSFIYLGNESIRSHPGKQFIKGEQLVGY